MTEKEKILQEIEKVKARQSKLSTMAHAARSFTAQDRAYAEMASLDSVLMNLQLKIEYIKAKEEEAQYKAEHPELVEEGSSKPASEGTVESILEFFGE